MPIVPERIAEIVLQKKKPKFVLYLSWNYQYFILQVLNSFVEMIIQQTSTGLLVQMEHDTKLEHPCEEGQNLEN